MRPVLRQFRRNKINMTSVVSVILAVTAGVVTFRETFGQTTAYTVSELSAGGRSLAGSTTWAMLLGEQVILPQERLELPSGITAGLSQKHLGKLLGGEYSSASGINDAGEVAGEANTAESIVPFVWTPKGGLGRIPLLPGDNCGQAFGINKHGHVVGYSSGPNGAEHSCGRGRWASRNLGILPGGNYSRASDINDLDEVVGTSGSAAGERAVLWTKTAIYAILGRYRGIRRVRLAQSTTMGMSLGTRKVHGGCALFCGLKQLECRIWGCYLVVTPAERLVSTTWVLWLEVRQARREIAPLFGQNKTGMRDLNSAASVASGAVFVEAHAINNTGQILVMGSPMHESHMSGEATSQCAPAPPSSFLLTPVSN